MKPFTKILVPTDFSEHAEEALQSAVDLAGRYGASITLANIFEPIVYSFPEASGFYAGLQLNDAIAEHGKALEKQKQSALAAGAIRAHVLDYASALVGEVVWPLVQAGVEPLPTAQTLAAPLIARALVEIARVERASGVAHAARGAAARQLDALLRSLDGQAGLLQTGELHQAGPDALARYLEARGIPFVFSSGLSAAEIEDRHRHRPFISKPFSGEDLRDGILRALQTQRPDANAGPLESLEQSAG